MGPGSAEVCRVAAGDPRGKGGAEGAGWTAFEDGALKLKRE